MSACLLVYIYICSIAIDMCDGWKDGVLPLYSHFIALSISRGRLQATMLCSMFWISESVFNVLLLAPEQYASAWLWYGHTFIYSFFLLIFFCSIETQYWTMESKEKEQFHVEKWESNFHQSINSSSHSSQTFRIRVVVWRLCMFVWMWMLLWLSCSSLH